MSREFEIPFQHMRMRPSILPIFLLLLGVIGCNSAGTSAAQSTGAAATAPVQPGIPVLATPIRIVIPAGLATGATAETIDVVTDQTGAPWDVAPAHLQLALQGYSVDTTAHVPQVFVYPAQPYAAMNPSAAESLKRLQAVLANPSGSYDKDTLPRVPFLNAAQVFAAQQKVIRFSGGSGVRFITQYGQDVSPINNSGLFYHFEGLTGNDKYYIVAILPVNLPFLAADNNPGSPLPSNGIPFPAPSGLPDDYNNYYQQLSQRIDAAPASEFSPSLGTLDELMQSLTVDQ